MNICKENGQCHNKVSIEDLDESIKRCKRNIKLNKSCCDLYERILELEKEFQDIKLNFNISDIPCNNKKTEYDKHDVKKEEKDKHNITEHINTFIKHEKQNSLNSSQVKEKSESLKYMDIKSASGRMNQEENEITPRKQIVEDWNHRHVETFTKIETQIHTEITPSIEQIEKLGSNKQNIHQHEKFNDNSEPNHLRQSHVPPFNEQPTKLTTLDSVSDKKEENFAGHEDRFTKENFRIALPTLPQFDVKKEEQTEQIQNDIDELVKESQKFATQLDILEHKINHQIENQTNDNQQIMKINNPNGKNKTIPQDSEKKIHKNLDVPKENLSEKNHSKIKVQNKTDSIETLKNKSENRTTPEKIQNEAVTKKMLEVKSENKITPASTTVLKTNTKSSITSSTSTTEKNVGSHLFLAHPTDQLIGKLGNPQNIIEATTESLAAFLERLNNEDIYVNSDNTEKGSDKGRKHGSKENKDKNHDHHWHSEEYSGEYSDDSDDHKHHHHHKISSEEWSCEKHKPKKNPTAEKETNKHGKTNNTTHIDKVYPEIEKTTIKMETHEISSHISKENLFIDNKKSVSDKNQEVTEIILTTKMDEPISFHSLLNTDDRKQSDKDKGIITNLPAKTTIIIKLNEEFITEPAPTTKPASIHNSFNIDNKLSETDLPVTTRLPETTNNEINPDTIDLSNSTSNQNVPEIITEPSFNFSVDTRAQNLETKENLKSKELGERPTEDPVPQQPDSKARFANIQNFMPQTNNNGMCMAIPPLHYHESNDKSRSGDSEGRIVHPIFLQTSGSKGIDNPFNLTPMETSKASQQLTVNSLMPVCFYGVPNQNQMAFRIPSK